ncbi:hypothetical protein CapIbe_008653 [Capra ibex]
MNGKKRYSRITRLPQGSRGTCFVPTDTCRVLQPDTDDQDTSAGNLGGIHGACCGSKATTADARGRTALETQSLQVLDQQGRAPALPHLEARSPRHRSRDNRKRGCPSRGGDASEPPFSSAAPLGAGQAITDELPGFSQGEQGGPGRQRMLSFLPASRRLTRT